MRIFGFELEERTTGRGPDDDGEALLRDVVLGWLVGALEAEAVFWLEAK